jgi:5-methylcytosine-specific restriction endonuclease McrA
MANNWNIPAELEVEVRLRDRACVYCGTEFTSYAINRKKAASWEHIINDASIINRDNIALCCCGCNASKGQKRLSEWLRSKYCILKGMNYTRLAPIIKKALDREL